MSKKNLILGGILLVLIAVAYIQQGPWQEWKQNMGKADNFLQEVNAEEIERIEISESTSTSVILEKEEKGWKVGGTKDFYVKDTVEQKLNETIVALSKADLEIVSKNKRNKTDFETDGSGVDVKFIQNDKEYELVIGKSGSSISSTYISRPGDDKTYEVEANLRNVFSRDDWRDDQIFSFMRERAKEIRFQYPNREFKIEKINNEWKGTAPYEFQVSEEKINEILDTMGTLKSAEIPEQKFDGTGLEKHLIIVEIKDTINSYTLMVGDKNEDGLYYVKKGSSDNIYLITEEEKEVFETNISQLK